LRPRSSELGILGGILLTALGLRVAAAVVSAPVDDAFITYRYAANLAAGHGFVYQNGERVLGTTTPLFALLLAVPARAGVPPPTAAIALGILADLVTCVLVYRMFRGTWGAGPALTASFAYAVSYAAVAACGYGMEAETFVLASAAALAAAASRRPVTAAACAGLAALIRPEGFLLAAVAGVYVLAAAGRSRPGRTGGAALTFAVITGGWFLFAWRYFGSPIPNSVLAKMGQDGVSPGQWLHFFVARNPLVVLAWVGAAAGAGIGWRRRTPAAWLLAVWAVVYAGFFFIERPPFFGAWYFPPAAMPLFVLAGAAAAFLLGGILRRPRLGAWLAAGLLAAAAIAVLPRALDSVRWNRTVADRVDRPLASFVAGSTPPAAVIHASDIGYLGYYGDRRILDAAALVTPDLRRFRAEHAGEPDWDVAFVLERRPDYVVLPLQRGIYAKFISGPFAGAYLPVARFQVEGETDLHPPLDVTDRYRGDPRYMADFIVYRRIDS